MIYSSFGQLEPENIRGFFYLQNCIYKEGSGMQFNKNQLKYFSVYYHFSIVIVTGPSKPDEYKFDFFLK